MKFVKVGFYLVLFGSFMVAIIVFYFVHSDLPNVQKLCLYVFRENDSKKKRKERSVFVGKHFRKYMFISVATWCLYSLSFYQNMNFRKLYNCVIWATALKRFYSPRKYLLFGPFSHWSFLQKNRSYFVGCFVLH